MNENILRRFPKTRPELPAEIAEIYSRHYKSNREGETAAASLAQRVEAWMHRKVAADVRYGKNKPTSTLEVGAGTLNQLPYEPEVGPYDIVEPFSDLFRASPHLPRVRRIFSDLSEVTAEQRYDRITSIAAFEHILDLPRVVARCGILLASNGTLRVAIPSEGTLLWALGWKLTTGLEFKLKYGLDYGQLMRHEHVNTASEIRAVLEHFFADVRGAAFGICNALSLYQLYSCCRPRVEKCQSFLYGSQNWLAAPG
jgi:hypothetical protein